MEEGFVFIHPAFCGMIGSGSDQSLTTLLYMASELQIYELLVFGCWGTSWP